MTPLFKICNPNTQEYRGPGDGRVFRGIGPLKQHLKQFPLHHERPDLVDDVIHKIVYEVVNDNWKFPKE